MDRGEAARYRPGRIFLEKSVRESLITRNVLARLPDVPVSEIESTESLLAEYRERTPGIPVAKRSLILARHRGAFFKPCPGRQSRGDSRNVCCNYFVINFGTNCHMECSYCYLQSYLNFPYMIIYANVEDLLEELDSVFRSNVETLFRVGTGELADSLALDPITSYSAPLVEFFAGQPNAILELKTKSDCVEGLLGLDHRGKTVVAWSLNPPYVQQKEEHKTATIDRRFRAARLCAKNGYKLAFHLDPIVHYDGWDSDYLRLIDQMFDAVPRDSIVWVSLGALRMNPELKEIMRRRFPDSFLPLGELVPGEDGKLRYAKPIRKLMYALLLDAIRKKASPRTGVYACMERPEVWSRAFGGKEPPLDEEVGNELFLTALE